MFTKILVPLDGSSHADKALDYALDLASRYHASVQLLTVIPEVSLFSTLAYPAGETVPVGVGQYYEDLKARGKEMLTAALHAAQRMNPQINVTSKVVEGRRVSDDIVTAATDGAFDLIVMSSRGLGGITGFLLGNVADRVADHSTCPVLIVK